MIQVTSKPIRIKLNIQCIIDTSPETHYNHSKCTRSKRKYHTIKKMLIYYIFLLNATLSMRR